MDIILAIQEIGDVSNKNIRVLKLLRSIRIFKTWFHYLVAVKVISVQNLN